MTPYRWATPGDINAFCGLVLDNLAVMVLLVSMLVGTYGFDASFALRYMIPGTALGVVVGDLCFTWMAFRLAARTGRNDVTAMPLGLDTPSTFGMVFFVLGDAFVTAKAAGLAPEEACRHAWHIGICALITSGVFKLACATLSGWIRQIVPRAGLLGSLAAIALVLIGFLPLLEVAHLPVVGYVTLAVILTALVARVPLPGRVPGALGALVVGCVVYFLMSATGTLGYDPGALSHTAFEPQLGLLVPWPSLAWLDTFGASLKYLPVVIPFALATVVGGIDCTESAAAAGDEYSTGRVIAIEGLATLVAGLCGGVIQTTPYIGQPAYKAMGGRAAYTLAAALFIGLAGMTGSFAYVYAYLPKPAIFPILIFIGLEITAQSYHATPQRHYPAVGLACLPAIAYLVVIFTDNLLAQTGTSVAALKPPLDVQLPTLRVLSAGFIVTSLLWAATLASIIDGRLKGAAGFVAAAALLSAFGVIHSPLPGSPMFLPWNLDTRSLPPALAGQTPYHLAAAYGLVAALLFGWGLWLGDRKLTVDEAP
ncbi:MAG: permease [Pirellulales bacterium]|nr:permease [Pirellulales bacterium]